MKSMWKIDYHIHTIFSDGGSNPRQIVKTAAEQGMDAVAITDHDGIDGVDEAMKAGRDYGIEVASGIELATEYENGDVLHILGYGFDPRNKLLNDSLTYMTEERNKRNLKLVRLLQEMGCDITMDAILKGRKNTFVGKPNIARYLQEKGYVEDWLDAFKPGEFLESSEAKKIKKVKVDSREAVKTITAAGGIAVLAHPIQAKGWTEPDDENYYNKIDTIVADLKKEGLSGIECYHPDQDRAQTLRFLDIAQKYGMKVSRGTDFHYADYHNTKMTADYIEEGNADGYGVYPRDFIKV